MPIVERGNIWFEQVPITGIPNKYVLQMGCKDCREEVRLLFAIGRSCQWWINLFEMKHNRRKDCKRGTG